MDTAVSSSNCRIEALESQLMLQKKALLGEEVFRKRVEADYRRLQEEKRTLVVRYESGRWKELPHFEDEDILSL